MPVPATLPVSAVLYLSAVTVAGIAGAARPLLHAHSAQRLAAYRYTFIADIANALAYLRVRQIPLTSMLVYSSVQVICAIQ